MTTYYGFQLNPAPLAAISESKREFTDQVKFVKQRLQKIAPDLTPDQIAKYGSRIAAAIAGAGQRFTDGVIQERLSEVLADVAHAADMRDIRLAQARHVGEVLADVTDIRDDQRTILAAMVALECERMADASDAAILSTVDEFRTRQPKYFDDSAQIALRAMMTTKAKG